MALQCPKCPLRFDLKPMLADHLATDHGARPEAVAHLQPPAARVGLVPPPDPATERPPEDSGDGPGADLGHRDEGPGPR